MVNREKLKSKYGDEQVLVVDTEEVLNTLNLKEGFNWMQASRLQSLNLKWMPRYEAEYNPTVKQLIPYIVINRGSRFLTTKRLAKSGEARLVDRCALGVGGHINPVDGSIEDAARRELHEELYIAHDLPMRFLGIIYDTSNSVSQDHLGLFFLVSLLPSEYCAVKEVDKLDGKYLTINELLHLQDEGKLESWAEIVLDVLIKSTYSYPEARITLEW